MVAKEWPQERFPCPTFPCPNPLPTFPCPLRSYPPRCHHAEPQIHHPDRGLRESHPRQDGGLRDSLLSRRSRGAAGQHPGGQDQPRRIRRRRRPVCLRSGGSPGRQDPVVRHRQPGRQDPARLAFADAAGDRPRLGHRVGDARVPGGGPGVRGGGPERGACG